MWYQAILAATIVWTISLIGLLLPTKMFLLSKLGPSIISVAAGLMIGESLYHLICEQGSNRPSYAWAVIGAMAIIAIRTVASVRHRGHDTRCRHQTSSFVPALLTANAVHSVLDGLIIATAYLTNVRVGIGVTLAICMHELPREAGDYAALIAIGTVRNKAAWWNAISTLPVVAGSIAGLSAGQHSSLAEPLAVFAAGSFAATGCFLILAARALPFANTRHIITCTAVGLALSLACEICGFT